MSKELDRNSQPDKATNCRNRVDLRVRRAVRFTLDEAEKAANSWGFNCGPGALCAILDMTPNQIRPHMGDFEKKSYTNPTLMFEILERLNVKYKKVYRADDPNGFITLKYGLMRIQWGGRWTKPDVPIRARYRHTHWIAMQNNGETVFDINAICVGGWLPFREWNDQLVPWLCKQVVRGWNGEWWPTHAIEIEV